MKASWEANASRASGSFFAHLNHIGIAWRRNFWMSASDSRMICTPSARYLSQAVTLAFWMYAN